MKLTRRKFMFLSSIVMALLFIFSSMAVFAEGVDAWTTKAPMVDARKDFGVAVVDGKIYAIGGSNGLNSVEEYNPATNTWTTKAPMAAAREYLEVAVVDEKIYAIGGRNNSNLKSVEEYTPESTSPAAPTNLTATAGNAEIALSWTAVTGATGYNVKRSTTAGGPYTTIATCSAITYTDTAVTNGTTYYYVVTAVTTAGESANSNEASATPQAPASTGKVLLVITMVNDTEKEYELSMTEVDSFINWYDTKAAGTGKAYYVFDKKYNKANFLSRKDYIVFDKIRDFEVMQYE